MAQTLPYPFVTNLIEKFREWRKSWRDLQDLRDLGVQESERLAEEVGLSVGALDTLVRQGAKGSKELPELLTTLKIDQQALLRSDPRLLGDMHRVCSACASKRRCSNDLAKGTSAEHFEDYCGNASTIEAIKNQEAVARA